MSHSTRTRGANKNSRSRDVPAPVSGAAVSEAARPATGVTLSAGGLPRSLGGVRCCPWESLSMKRRRSVRNPTPVALHANHRDVPLPAGGPFEGRSVGRFATIQMQEARIAMQQALSLLLFEIIGRRLYSRSNHNAQDVDLRRYIQARDVPVMLGQNLDDRVTSGVMVLPVGKLKSAAVANFSSWSREVTQSQTF